MLVDNPYYYRLRGQTVGPLSLEQIQQRVYTGRLGKRTAVSRDGQLWKVAEEFPELFNIDSLSLSLAQQLPSSTGGVPPLIWSFQTVGGRQGEADGDAIRKMVHAGELTHADRVWRAGMEAWQPIGSVSELAFGVNKASRKSKYIAATLAFFLGGLGIHHFYLGNTGLGILYLLFCWTLVPAAVAFIEFIVFLVIPKADFDLRYNDDPLPKS